MKKRVYILFIIFPAIGFSQTLSDCDLLYSKRGPDLISAQDCYQDLFNQNKIPNADFFERSFTTLSTAVAFFEKTTEERMVLDKGFVVLEAVKKAYGETPYYNYWKAVWVSFDALEKDRGKLIPTYLFSQIGTIQNLLKSAAQDDPTTDYYGPNRVIGILHTQMPKIAGGDKKYAEIMLRQAYEAYPEYHSNPYAYANVLYINGKSDEAKAILKKFLDAPNERYELFTNEPLRSLDAEIRKEKDKAQQLLNTIIDEE